MAYSIAVIFIIQYWEYCYIKKKTYDDRLLHSFSNYESGREGDYLILWKQSYKKHIVNFSITQLMPVWGWTVHFNVCLTRCTAVRFSHRGTQQRGLWTAACDCSLCVRWRRVVTGLHPPGPHAETGEEEAEGRSCCLGRQSRGGWKQGRPVHSVNLAETHQSLPDFFAFSFL